MEYGIWNDFLNQIKTHLQNDDINNFLNWNILKSTMIAGVDEIEFVKLKESKFWPQWESKLSESHLKPNNYHNFPSSSTNNMHHAYSLNVLMEFIDQDLSVFNTIVEFGGGYGNTCRLLKNWKDSKIYLYDIPELLQIQKHYLTTNNILNDVHYLSGEDKVDNIIDPSLFIGLWSISETPTHERAKMLENLKFFDCDVIFIAMGDKFYNEDNITWLDSEIIPKLDSLDYIHKLHKIEHGNGMYYFMAKKKQF